MIASLLGSLSSGRETATSLVDCTIARAADCSDLNLFSHLDVEAARTAARSADKRRRAAAEDGNALPPLLGIPFVVKDNIAVADMPYSGGSRALGDAIPAADAPLVALLRDAGAIPVGTTNLHEFAFGVTSNNPVFGPVRNPTNSHLSAGGSSGGTAAAVARKVVPFGLATDTGGSGRIPASFCGCVGFRPSTARYSGDGMMTLSWTLDSPALMAASVADISLLDELVMDVHAGPALPSAPMRLGIPRSSFAAKLDPMVDTAFAAALKKLQEAGAQLVDVDLTAIMAHDAAAAFPIVMFEANIIWRKLLAEKEIPIDRFLSSIASPDVRLGFTEAFSGAVNATAYGETMQSQLGPLRTAYAQCFDQYDITALAFPTVPVPPPPVHENDTVEINGETFPLFPAIIRNTSPSALGGLPGVSIPAGQLANGLPFGLELDARAGADTNLLVLAQQLEDILK